MRVRVYQAGVPGGHTGGCTNVQGARAARGGVQACAGVRGGRTGVRVYGVGVRA